MINSLNLYKLVVGNTYPKCVNCKFYTPGLVGNGLCKLYGDILEARVTKNSHLCGLDGMSFKQQEFVKRKQSKLLITK